VRKQQVLITRKAYKTRPHKFQVRRNTETTLTATLTLLTLRSGYTSPTLVSQTQTDPSLSFPFLPLLSFPTSLEVALATDFLSTCPCSCTEDSDKEFQLVAKRRQGRLLTYKVLQHTPHKSQDLRTIFSTLIDKE
jgi:hypothetical protein